MCETQQKRKSILECSTFNELGSLLQKQTVGDRSVMSYRDDDDYYIIVNGMDFLRLYELKHIQNNLELDFQNIKARIVKEGSGGYWLNLNNYDK